MGSGKYSAVSGMIGRMRMMDNISEHLASIKTHSYKKGVPTFEAKLAEATSGMATKGANQVRVTGETIDFTPGQLEFTGNPMHVAINGEGFFQVQQENGEFAYTRRGSFQIDAEGNLTDTDGRQVMNTEGGLITLPDPAVDIAPDGKIWYDGEEVAQIGVYQFDDTSVLQRAENSAFIPVDGSRPLLHPEPKLAQNNLETSNVDMMQAMVKMTSNLRAFEATQKALRIYSDMGSKAADLGLVQ